VHYNLGLALQQMGRRQPAEQALLRAQQLAPQDAATVYALAVFYAQGGERALALQWAERLRTLSPDDPRCGSSSSACARRAERRAVPQDEVLHGRHLSLEGQGGPLDALRSSGHKRPGQRCG